MRSPLAGGGLVRLQWLFVRSPWDVVAAEVIEAGHDDLHWGRRLIDPVVLGKRRRGQAEDRDHDDQPVTGHGDTSNEKEDACGGSSFTRRFASPGILFGGAGSSQSLDARRLVRP